MTYVPVYSCGLDLPAESLRPTFLVCAGDGGDGDGGNGNDLGCFLVFSFLLFIGVHLKCPRRRTIPVFVTGGWMSCLKTVGRFPFRKSEIRSPQQCCVYLFRDCDKGALLPCDMNGYIKGSVACMGLLL